MEFSETAILGNGCFWCTEAIFSRLKGIYSVTSGYAGGKIQNPSYYDVSKGNTGHAEVLKIEFNPKEISYEQLLDVFYHTHDPTSLNKQGADVGTQYRSIILYNSKEQKKTAEQFTKKVQKDFDKPIVTEIVPLDTFYDAESYHQNYYEKNSFQPYCQLVITPKVDTFQKRYKALLKKKT
ncbi:MAG TPA: peptide-methionine (S)-S-oxide reductase MsrA [Candidatus Woesebacteria bacterium]|nr:peptide-methionine (S)-S-oxide reductase MsrA [Candidatus Woesebacteria bacterium]